MEKKIYDRRDFMLTMLGGVGLASLNWEASPQAPVRTYSENQYDVIIIGAGLGGLSCATAFARKGYKTLIIEQHSKPGGYATTFKRGDFIFDVSMHSVGSPPREDGRHNLIGGFPEITDVEFVPHPELYRAVFPDYDVRVEQQNPEGYIAHLKELFPGEQAGIDALFNHIEEIMQERGKFSAALGGINWDTVDKEYPKLYECYFSTWAELMDKFIQNQKLRAMISAQWIYYGLPPSKLASSMYASAHRSYLKYGGYYAVGRSQKISDALLSLFKSYGGICLLKTKAKNVLIDHGTATGIRTSDGNEYSANTIISNGNVYSLFHELLPPDDAWSDYLAKLDSFSPSLSAFVVWMGLKKELVKELGIKETEIFYYNGYDLDKSFADFSDARVENCDIGITLYDNIYEGYSPDGKNNISLIVLQGYDHWKPYETDYFAGNKKEYRAEKERMADILIKRVEGRFLPGLSDAIEVKEIGTPLTNIRYTSNYQGAIYGWNHTPDNSGVRRLPHKTPVKNLYLTGAWTQPSHGYNGVIWSGLECFNEIMQGG